MNKNLTYQEEQYKKRIKNLEKIAKERISEEIIKKDKRTPTKKEINDIYRQRLMEYDVELSKTNRGIATGGPASSI